MPTRNRDLSAILPDGNEYEFWEEDCTYTKTLYVDCSNPASSDDNDGSEGNRSDRVVFPDQNR